MIHIQGFAAQRQPSCTLMSVKQSIREGRVLWLHGRVKPQHWSKPTWFTQCCRLAHRAAAQWTLEFTRSPWHIKPFEAWRRHKYVRDLGASETSRWFGSKRVTPHTSRVEQVLEQAAQMHCQEGDAARWLGESTDLQGEATRKGTRRAEDMAAVGGLRSPHKSVNQIAKAPAFSKWLSEL